MGRFDGDAALLFGWDAETKRRIAEQKRAKAHTVSRKHVPAKPEIDWRKTDWRSTPWHFEGQEDLLIAGNDGTSVEGARE